MTPAGGIDFETLVKKYRWPSHTNDSRASVRLNMAVDAAGESIDPAGSSTGLSFTEDRQLLKAIRFDADAVVVGASTVRAEGWNLPPTGVLVVLSKSGNLPWATCPERERVRVISQSDSMRSIVSSLEEQGMFNILVEGGVSIARLFAQENLFDEVCLTVSLGDANAEATVAVSRALEKLLAVDSQSFERVSLVPAVTVHAVFTLWRRALNSPPLTAH